MATYNIAFYPKSLGRKVDIKVVIPSLNLRGALGNTDDEYYQNRTTKYPLIIFLCGFGDYYNTWAENTSIINHLETNHVAGCFVSGENKWYLNHGQIEDFDAFIERDIPDFLYGNFKNLSKEKPLIIAGQSMGGYGAMRHYLQHPDKYAAGVALSPATKPDFLDENKFGGTIRDLFLQNKDRKLNLYLSVGNNDFIIEASKELDKFLEDNNIDARYKFIPNVDHSWPTWDNEIASVLNYLRNKGFIGEMPPNMKRR